MELYIENEQTYAKEVKYENLPKKSFSMLFANNSKKSIYHCYFNKDKDNHFLTTSYYVGVDWIVQNTSAIYIPPKLDINTKQTNYLKMLFDALKHPEVLKHTSELFEIKFDDTPIEIKQEQDLLTPLLVVQFLGIVQQIVKKGLKKSYYRVEKNLTAKVKGKILVNQSIKKNIVKNDILKTYCSYDEFGFNGLENRLLKKALLFVQRYLPTIPHIDKNNLFINNTLHYILPVFESVSEEIELHEIKHSKFNAFYKSYEEAIRLAKLILKRFGYNINQTSEQKTIKTPPFWIDMSKLFELYVLGLLKNEFGNLVDYHERGNYGETDFILQEPKMIIDTKYKKGYANGECEYLIEDVRQLSGYARDVGVLKKLKCYDENNKDETKVIPCLIVHYDKDLLTQEEAKSYEINLDEKIEIKQFVKFYKLAVKLPEIGNK